MHQLEFLILISDSQSIYTRDAGSSGTCTNCVGSFIATRKCFCSKFSFKQLKLVAIITLLISKHYFIQPQHIMITASKSVGESKNAHKLVPSQASQLKKWSSHGLPTCNSSCVHVYNIYTLIS